MDTARSIPAASSVPLITDHVHKRKMSLRKVSEIVLDGLGHGEMAKVSVDTLKSRFFILGIQLGLTLQRSYRTRRPQR